MGDFFGIGIGEVLLVLIVAIIALGPERMVGLGRALGKLMYNMKKASSELTTQVAKELEQEKRSQPQPGPDKTDTGSRV